MLDKSIVLSVLISIIAIAISAQLSFEIPTSGGGIPITGQSLAVLAVLYLLPDGYGVLSIAIYLILGIVGLPIFADASSGFDKLIGNSGGYLYGFLICGIVLTLLFPHRTAAMNSALSFMTLGTSIILLIGTLHLSVEFGMARAIEYGVTPFVPGAIIKILMGTAIVLFFKAISNRMV